MAGQNPLSWPQFSEPNRNRLNQSVEFDPLMQTLACRVQLPLVAFTQLGSSGWLDSLDPLAKRYVNLVESSYTTWRRFILHSWSFIDSSFSSFAIQRVGFPFVTSHSICTVQRFISCRFLAGFMMLGVLKPNEGRLLQLLWKRRQEGK